MKTYLNGSKVYYEHTKGALNCGPYFGEEAFPDLTHGAKDLKGREFRTSPFDQDGWQGKLDFGDIVELSFLQTNRTAAAYQPEAMQFIVVGVACGSRQDGYRIRTAVSCRPLTLTKKFEAHPQIGFDSEDLRVVGHKDLPLVPGISYPLYQNEIKALAEIELEQKTQAGEFSYEGYSNQPTGLIAVMLLNEKWVHSQLKSHIRKDGSLNLRWVKEAWDAFRTKEYKRDAVSAKEAFDPILEPTVAIREPRTGEVVDVKHIIDWQEIADSIAERLA